MRIAVILGLGFAFLVSAMAEVHLPQIFSDGMVLQRSAKTPVWGWADPGEEITVKIGASSATAKADNGGKWRLALDLRGLTAGPHELTINQVTIHDVLLGEVWLCGGQSNMVFTLAQEMDAKQILLESSNPQIRQFHVPKRSESAPVDDIQGKWMMATPPDIGRFTAVGYHFARKLNKELGVPVGLISAAWGSSACETWMSQEAIAALPAVAEEASRLENEIKTYPEKHRDFIRDFRAWKTSNERLDPPSPPVDKILALPEEKWESVTLPRPPKSPAEPGVVWFRRPVDIPHTNAGKQITLMIGMVQMLEEVYWNGQKVGATALEDYETGRYGVKHTVPANLVREGVNDLLIRVWSPEKTPNFTVSEEYFRAGSVPLAGSWKQWRETLLPPPASSPPAPPVQLPLIQGVASRAFNGMIAPLNSYGIAGIIWYQGENNAHRAAQYREVFPALIRDWRRQWGDEEMPFFWCQLANYRPKEIQPGENAWAELREAQSLALSLPATGQAVTIDVGEAADIHPRNKSVPGQRLADIALAKVYGREAPTSGPVFSSATFDKGRAIVSFSDHGGGLVAAPVPETHILTSVPPVTAPLIRNSPNSQLEGFAVCGADRVWHWADAMIDGDTVVAWSTAVPEPIAVRYAWAGNPTANLQGQNKLPAVPFRSDDFPLQTAGKTLP